ncbi:MAG: thiamine diphosphokinase [Clostridia bacterium]|nr:thiamine diphosphokinase [Clostridia bacterium]
MNKRAIIIVNGYEINYNYYKSKYTSDDYIICADGAINHCIKMGIIPDLWIGDFDSCNFDDILLHYPEYNRCEILRLNPVKDETDTQKACMVAIERGYSDIFIWCANGKRADHMLSTIHLLEFLHKNQVNGTIEDSMNLITIFDDEIYIKKQRNYFSLIPLDNNVLVNDTVGLKYSLHNKILPREISLGVSNEIINDTAFVKISNGLMLAIQSDD